VAVTEQSDGAAEASEPSLGDLVKEASTQFSTVLHGEIELAKIELKSTFKYAGTGIVMFVAAAVLVIFSLTFGFIALAEGLVAAHIWRWAAYLIVFGFIFLLAMLSALIGWRRVRKVRAPQRTIATTKSTVATLRHPHQQP
jgi:uncharacterized membrane protein YqjE